MSDTPRPEPPALPAPSAPHPIDWLLLGRYAVLISLCALIPIPIVDTWVENVLRRRLVNVIAVRHGHPFDSLQSSVIGNAPSGGCMGCLWSVIAWPVKKVIKTLSVVFQVKGIADTLSEVMHRSLMLEEAFEAGWLPGNVDAVRQAMDRTLAAVDTRPVERLLMGSLRDVKSELNLAIWETVRVTRARLGNQPAQALADAAEADTLGPGLDRASRAMVASLKTSALVPEVVAWFRAEMGEPPKIEPRLQGPFEPELVGDEPVAEAPPALPAPVEDAVEVPPADGSTEPG